LSWLVLDRHLKISNLKIKIYVFLKYIIFFSYKLTKHGIVFFHDTINLMWLSICHVSVYIFRLDIIFYRIFYVRFFATLNVQFRCFYCKHSVLNNNNIFCSVYPIRFLLHQWRSSIILLSLSQATSISSESSHYKSFYFKTTRKS